MLPVTSDCCSTVVAIKGMPAVGTQMEAAVWRQDIKHVKDSGCVTVVRNAVSGDDDGALGR